MKLKVENTETGEVVNIRLESTVELFKFEISLMFPIPPHEQIILYGPPYKVIDSVYSDLLNQFYGVANVNPTIDTKGNGNNLDNDVTDKYTGGGSPVNNINKALNTTFTSNIPATPPGPPPLSIHPSTLFPSPSPSTISSKRCFLYNKKLLASDDKEPKLVRLLPLKPSNIRLSDIIKPSPSTSLHSSHSEDKGKASVQQSYEQFYRNILQQGVAHECFIADR